MLTRTSVIVRALRSPESRKSGATLSALRQESNFPTRVESNPGRPKISPQIALVIGNRIPLQECPKLLLECPLPEVLVLSELAGDATLAGLTDSLGALTQGSTALHALAARGVRATVSFRAGAHCLLTRRAVQPWAKCSNPVGILL
jgi:hypothetical protein